MKWITAGVLLGLAALLGLGIAGVWPRPEFPDPDPIATEWDVENAVAAIVLGVRLWNTLFEVLVYALAMVGVRFFLSGMRWQGILPPLAETPLLRRSADLLFGPILVFAVYVAVSGHIGPGGGFPAGIILGSGLLLLALAKGVEHLSTELYEPKLEGLEYVAVAATLFLGAIVLIMGVRSSAAFVAGNLLVALEVAIGAWVVVHRFASARGEV